ncbi:MAG TPA: porin [Methylophilaceae bacterium]|nr:porin [Methylophilaceae bacterium]
MAISSKRLLQLAVALAAVLPLAAQAEGADTEARIRELENQLQVLSQQLAAMREQLAAAPQRAPADEVKPAKSEAKPAEAHKVEGSPVYAAFKDGVVLSDASGDWKLAINGRVQADYRQFSPDADAADTFSLRRARLGGTFTFYHDYVARVEGEYSGSSTMLTYAYIDFNKFSAAKLRVGQFKPFYGLERAMSTNFTDFQERSLADALLGSTYDRGVMLFGSPWTGVNYSVAYVNGNGTSDEGDARSDGKDATVRVTANLAEMAGWKDAVLHLGGFYADGHEGSGSAAPKLQTEGRGVTFFSVPAFSSDVDRRRDGLETALAYGPVKLQSEYIKTQFDGPGYEREMNGWYASVMWNVTGESFAKSYKDGVFGRLRPHHDFSADGKGWGALQVGLRYSNFDADDFVPGNSAGTGKLGTGLTNGADAWALGANWILNPNVRFIANWIHTTYDTPVLVNGRNLDDDDALTMRAQFDF